MEESGAVAEREWIPGQCIFLPRLQIQVALQCPVGYYWKRGYYRKKRVHQPDKYVDRVFRKVQRKLYHYPQLCEHFDGLEEFHDCMKLVEPAVHNFLEHHQGRASLSQKQKFITSLVNQVLMCTGIKTKDRCFFKPTTASKLYIKNHINL